MSPFDYISGFCLENSTSNLFTADELMFQFALVKRALILSNSRNSSYWANSSCRQYYNRLIDEEFHHVIILKGTFIIMQCSYWVQKQSDLSRHFQSVFNENIPQEILHLLFISLYLWGVNVPWICKEKNIDYQNW